MVGIKPLLLALAMASALSTGGCALTISEFDDSAGWSDAAVHNGPSALYEDAALTPEAALPRERPQEVVTVGKLTLRFA
jgi:hypothetical protein